MAHTYWEDELVVDDATDELSIQRRARRPLGGEDLSAWGAAMRSALRFDADHTASKGDGAAEEASGAVDAAMVTSLATAQLGEEDVQEMQQAGGLDTSRAADSAKAMSDAVLAEQVWHCTCRCVVPPTTHNTRLRAQALYYRKRAF